MIEASTEAVKLLANSVMIADTLTGSPLSTDANAESDSDCSPIAADATTKTEEAEPIDCADSVIVDDDHSATCAAAVSVEAVSVIADDTDTITDDADATVCADSPITPDIETDTTDSAVTVCAISVIVADTFTPAEVTDDDADIVSADSARVALAVTTDEGSKKSSVIVCAESYLFRLYRDAAVSLPAACLRNRLATI